MASICVKNAPRRPLASRRSASRPAVAPANLWDCGYLRSDLPVKGKSPGARAGI